YATTLACLPQVQADGIPSFHYMLAVAGGMTLRCAAYATFGTQALSDAARGALADRRACLLAQHGMVALGASLDAAMELAADVEALCRIYWQALQIGAPALLDDAECARVMTRFERYRRGA
ncbi:MAG: class II aldolase/adducin family protein, partial [Burkholderiaceae bacterium]